MSIIQNDRYWISVAEFLKQCSKPEDLILAPNEFLDVLGNVSFYHVSDFLPPDSFRFIVVHKGMLDAINPGFLSTVVSSWTSIFANHVFVVFSSDIGRVPRILRRIMPSARRQQQYVTQLLQNTRDDFPPTKEVEIENDAIVLTTYNRNWALARSLPAAVGFGIPVLVVDDGSSQTEATKNQETCRHVGADYLFVPGNRGLPCALNAGLSYFLADPEVAWIATLQDDVRLAPDTFKALTAVRDIRERPILTPYYAKEHKVHGRATIEGYDVLFQRTAPGLMLYAHRDYWRDIMPIPTPYLGAPKKDSKRPGQGADEDWWITGWAPKSAPKRGLYITCIPNLAEHFADDAALSTWRNSDL